jgi:hypothetical protein
MCYWHHAGLLHRNSLPAVSGKNHQCWFVHGKLHRDGDQPAVVSRHNISLTKDDFKKFKNSGNDIGYYYNGRTHTSMWFRHGKLHRDNDRPALITPELTRWYSCGKLHRDNDLPAEIQNLGVVDANIKEAYWVLPKEKVVSLLDEFGAANYGQKWYQHGRLHRDGDLPAVICLNGDKFYYRNGQNYRADDKPNVVRIDGTVAWWRNDVPHRDDLPAIIDPDGNQQWYTDGKKHRLGAPAVVNVDGTYEIWRDGVLYTTTEQRIIGDYYEQLNDENTPLEDYFNSSMQELQRFKKIDVERLHGDDEHYMKEDFLWTMPLWNQLRGEEL